MLKPGDIIEFDRKKQFKYIRPLGKGGTGDTHLFEDETTDMLFAFKKYVPKDSRYIDDHYKRFVDEIKILLKLSHRNIVRVYNYYLYPDLKTGYIQMEYIDGDTIDKYVPQDCGSDWNNIFTDVISAFEYLESNKVLHRDIRTANILIDKENIVKIIDFGFGKQLESTSKNGKSVFLNWPVTELPEEVELDQEYNHKTEIYFVGKLFQKVVNNETDFKFNHIIENMTKTQPSKRYNSFGEVSKAISEGLLGEIYFNERDKEIYRNFADDLVCHLIYYRDRFSPINDINEVVSAIAKLIHDSALEEYIQNNSRLISCFLSNGYNYQSMLNIPVQHIINFYDFFRQLSVPKQKIVLDNIHMRLAKIKVNLNEDQEEIPF